MPDKIAIMPTISRFFGMSVRMYFLDHAPPHFHVRYNDREAQIAIDDLKIIEGDLPKRALALVNEWAHLHRAELAENWALCAAGKAPNAIQPLED